MALAVTEPGTVTLQGHLARLYVFPEEVVGWFVAASSWDRVDFWRRVSSECYGSEALAWTPGA